MKALALIALCGCSQIFGLNGPSRGTPSDGALDVVDAIDGALGGGCTTIADCPTSVCLPSGSCAADTDVAWLDPASTVTTPCTMATPCYRLYDALQTNRPYIRVHGTITNLTGISRAVSIFGEPGGGFGASMNLNISAAVEMYDLTSSSCMNAGSNARLTLSRVTIDGCGGIGVIANGALTIDRSIIRNNRNGGIQIAPNNSAAQPFSITNSFIVTNDPQIQSQYGGVAIQAASIAAGSRLDFNTIVGNEVKSGSTTGAGGVYCNDPLFSANDNIIAGNMIQNDAAATNANTAGACSFANNFVSSSVAGLAFAPGDYHLGTGSVAIDAVSDMTTTPHDIDGETRPLGQGYDFGADEYRP